jgi:DNA-binding response OmpR family regulator
MPQLPRAVPRPTVVLVEAEPMLRQTMTKFLQRSGHQVTAWGDAAEAEAQLTRSRTRPALIVLGVRVLDRSVADTARRLREAAPEVPMLGIADVLDEAGGDALALPDNLRFLAHPFDMPDVLRAIRSQLRRAGDARPRRQQA